MIGGRLPFRPDDEQAARLGRLWDELQAGAPPRDADDPERAELIAFIRDLRAHPVRPTPPDLHDRIFREITAHPSWSRARALTEPLDRLSAPSANGHGPVVAPPLAPLPAAPLPGPRPIRRLWPVVELIGLAAVILFFLYLAFGRDQQTATTTTPQPSVSLGDWPMPGGDAAHAGAAARSAPATKPVARWQAYLDPGLHQPIAAGDALFVSNGRFLFALALADGHERWRIDLGGDRSRPADPSPVVAGGVVYIPDASGALRALDAASGAERWTARTEGRIAAAVSVVDGVVYAGSDDGRLYAFDAATGAERWRAEVGPIAASSPAVADGTVYIGADRGVLVAVDVATGEPRWRRTICETGIKSPSVLGDAVYVPCRIGGGVQTYALGATDGDYRWQVDGDADRPPIVAGGLLYVTDLTLRVAAYNAVTGRQRWIGNVTGGSITDVVLTSDVLLVGSRGLGVLALDPADGAELYRLETAVPPTGLAVGDKALYIADGDGAVTAYAEAPSPPRD